MELVQIPSNWLKPSETSGDQMGPESMGLLAIDKCSA